MSIRSLERLAVAIACVVPLLRAIAFLLGWRDGLTRYTWFVADGIAMGAWLAMYVRREGASRLKLARASSISLAIALTAAVVGAHWGILTRQRVLGAAFQESCGNLGLLGAFGFALLGGTGRWRFLIRQQVLKFYGNISYGLYLIHLLVFSAYDQAMKHYWPQLVPSSGEFGIATIRFVICLISASVLAYLSRQYFEAPWLRMKDRLAPSTPRARNNSVIETPRDSIVRQTLEAAGDKTSG